MFEFSKENHRRSTYVIFNNFNYYYLLMKYGMIEEAAKILKSCKDTIYELIGKENEFYIRTKSKLV